MKYTLPYEHPVSHKVYHHWFKEVARGLPKAANLPYWEWLDKTYGVAVIHSWSGHEYQFKSEQHKMMFLLRWS